MTNRVEILGSRYGIPYCRAAKLSKVSVRNTAAMVDLEKRYLVKGMISSIPHSLVLLSSSLR